MRTNVSCACVVAFALAFPATVRAGGFFQGPRLAGTGQNLGQAEQGYSVALSADGNTLIVGAPTWNNPMAAHPTGTAGPG